MKALKYKVIKSEKQYLRYMTIKIRLQRKQDRKLKAEIELLELLLDSWRLKHDPLLSMDPVALIKLLLKNENSTQSKLAACLEIDKGHLSNILRYKRSLSKVMIRKIAAYFYFPEYYFNRPYAIKPERKEPRKEYPKLQFRKLSK